MPESLVTAAKDLWPFIIFILTGWAAFLTGRERQRFKIDQIGRQLQEQDKRLSRLEVRNQEEAIALAEIRTQQRNILEALIEVKAALRGKVDK